MRRKFAKNFLGGDVRMVGQTFDHKHEAVKFCRLANNVVPDCKRHVRKFKDGYRCVIKANNVAQAWLLNFLALHTWCMKNNLEIPDLLRNHTRACMKHVANGRREWWLLNPKTNEDGNYERMTCKDYMEMVNTYIFLSVKNRK